MLSTIAKKIMKIAMASNKYGAEVSDAIDAKLEASDIADFATESYVDDSISDLSTVYEAQADLQSDVEAFFFVSDLQTISAGTSTVSAAHSLSSPSVAWANIMADGTGGAGWSIDAVSVGASNVNAVVTVNGTASEAIVIKLMAI